MKHKTVVKIRHLTTDRKAIASARAFTELRPHVNYRELVAGVVKPADAEVQLLVYSHDRKWYKQQKANVVDGHWSILTCFGFPESTGVYSVVAVAGYHIAPPSITDIPAEAATSETIDVERV